MTPTPDMDGARYQFDNELLAKKLYSAAWEKRLHYREMAKEIGISASTISRIVSDRKRPDVDSLARILKWLDADFADFIKEECPTFDETGAKS